MQIHRPFARAWGLTLACLAGLAPASPATAPPDLAAIAACVSAGPIKGVETQPRRGGPASRGITLADGREREVSVLDGYRVMLATAQGRYFVNLKLETSAPAQAAQDRSLIRQQMTEMATKAPQGAASLKIRQSGTIELLGLDQPDLDSRGPLGFYTLFETGSGVVATLYLLNQPPATRAFATMAEYEHLRDQALGQVMGCLPGSAG